MAAQDRDPYIDLLRGFAMMIVVTGHSLLYSLSNPSEVFLYKAICSFQMPLFMFVSGMNLKKDN